jgi:hypothetical protein
MEPKKIIVSTSIYAPSKALKLFDAKKDWTLIVAGDLKTPKDFKLDRGIYFTPEEQAALFPELSAIIGWNCIQRRNFAQLLAYALGADIVALVDDDNIPNEQWGKLFINKPTQMQVFSGNTPAFDPLATTNQPHLWHRGFPLSLVANRRYISEVATITADIQADLWNGDPDIDAVCRSMFPGQVEFSTKEPFSTTLPTPFNSQNTFLSRRVLRHYMVLAGIGRMDDIWGAYYAQAHGFKVVFSPASVTQERNNHSIIKDIKDEALGYAHSLDVVLALKQNPNNLFQLPFLPQITKDALNSYLKTIDQIDAGKLVIPDTIKARLK